MKAFLTATVAGLLFERRPDEAIAEIVTGLLDAPTPEFCDFIAKLLTSDHQGWRLQLVVEQGKPFSVHWTKIMEVYRRERAGNRDMQKVVVGRVCDELEISIATFYNAVRAEKRFIAEKEEYEQSPEYYDLLHGPSGEDSK